MKLLSVQYEDILHHIAQIPAAALASDQTAVYPYGYRLLNRRWHIVPGHHYTLLSLGSLAFAKGELKIIEIAQ